MTLPGNRNRKTNVQRNLQGNAGGDVKGGF